MRYLFATLMMFLPVTLLAQARYDNSDHSKLPHVEVGIKGGVVVPFNTSSLPSSSGIHTHPAIMYAMDVYADRHRSPFSFTMGMRVGYAGSIGAGATMGVKYNKEINHDIDMRLGLVVGGWLEWQYGNSPGMGVQGNIIPELTWGYLLWERLYVGLCYFQPCGPYTYWEHSGYSPYVSHEFNQSSLMLDIKVRSGRRR